MSVSAQSVLSRWAAFDEVLAALSKGVPCLRADGLWGSSRALATAGLLQRTGRPILVLTPGPVQRHQAAQDTAFFLATLSGGPSAAPIGEGRVLEFPSGSGASWRGGRHREPDAERALCCRRLLAGDAVAIVATPSGLSIPVPPPESFKRRTFTLTVGEGSDREILLALLEAAGYERVETVLEVGQWSLRGGIVDIFSPTHAQPVRAEFFGDEVESLRLFDPTPALDRPAPGADRAAARLPRRDAGHPARLPAGRDRDRARGSRAAGGAARRRALRRAARDPARALPAPRAAAAPARRRRGAPRLDGRALGGRLPRPVQDPRRPRSATGAARASRCAWWWTTSGSASACARCWPSTSSRRGPRRPSGAPRAWACWWASARPGSRSPRSAWSCSARRRSSAPSGGGCGGPCSSAARPSPRSPTWPRTTWWCTSSTASRATTASARSRPRGTTPTSCCSSTPRAAGSTCRWSGST